MQIERECGRFCFRTHLLPDLTFWACAKERGTRHETAQTEEMYRNECRRNHEWHYGRHSAECYQLKVEKRENYQPLLWENCVSSRLRATAEVESTLHELLFGLRIGSPPCTVGYPHRSAYLATCKLHFLSALIFDFPLLCFFHLFLLQHPQSSLLPIYSKKLSTAKNTW